MIPEIPVDATPGIGQAMPEYAAAGSLIIGLMPGEAISVAPSGMPVEPTPAPICEPSDMPSGEVAAMPGVGTLGPICAKAELHPNIATTPAIHRCLISGLRVDACGL